ncbi:MAG: phosphodiesterase, partial [Chlamydiales bacterium]|nr:phosphodiesterase [Chlamydiales bacterium]
MYNDLSIRAVGKSCFSKRFVKPLYDSYGFSRIPDTILQLLTKEA